MMTMKPENFGNHRTVSLRKFRLIETITATKDEKFLAAMEELLKKYRIAEYERKMQPLTKEGYNDEINKGFEAYMRGEVTSLEDYLKEVVSDCCSGF